MFQTILSRIAVTLLASLAASCSVGLEVARTTEEEIVREQVPASAPASFGASLAGDHLRIHIAKDDHVRIDKYEIETVKRYRAQKVYGLSTFFDVVNPAAYLWDLAVVLSAPFRSDYDVAWGPLGGLAAVVIPGINSRAGSRASNEDLYDTSTSRTLLSSELLAAPRGVVTDLRVVTDHEVLSARTNHSGDVSIPLSRLRGAGTTGRTRVTIDYDGDLYALDLDGDEVTCTRIGTAGSR